ncbi:MAG: ATP-binding protein [Pseudomonadota bacterium]
MTNHPLTASLQARLLASVLGLVTLVWLLAAALTWYDARHELDELLDGHLAQAAALLVMQQAHPADGDEAVPDAPPLHKYAPRVAFQVFHEGALVMRSVNAGSAPMSAALSGFSSTQLADGSRWRVFAARGAENDVQVYVAELESARSDILGAVLRSMLLPLAFALPLVALAVWWAVRRGLLPLRLLGSQLRLRKPQALEPVQLADLPTEMQALVQSLNELLDRIASMVESERRFTADAAHELRTPIAAIRAQAQVALGAVSDAGQRQHALQATLAGCDRASRLVEQLLMLARLEAAPAASGTRSDLGELLQAVAADLAPYALRRQQILELDAPAPCAVQGDALLVSVLARNLLDNALRYSPDGARVLVSVNTVDGQPQLRIEDSGNGMTQAQIDRLGERFFRVIGGNEPGSGLGWSIVRRITSVLGAQVTVGRSAALGGLLVLVQWKNQTRQSAG